MPKLDVSSNPLILDVYACIHSKSNLSIAGIVTWKFLLPGVEARRLSFMLMHEHLRHVRSHRVCVPLWVCLAWGFVCNMEDSLLGLEVSSRLHNPIQVWSN